ncbi:MAG TPA: SDR family oxidoreductase [Ramlibacter sp.]|nr:SDR family oxidoreductase [Ramlibacter sp.]
MSTPQRPPAPRIDQSHVLICGGTAGVGLETACEFARRGAPGVVLVGRNAERGAAACRVVREAAQGAQVDFIQADANDVAQARRAVEQAAQKLGRIDVLVNATVGPFTPKLMHETAPEDIPAILSTQMLAPLLMSRLVLPLMREARSGLILNIASDAGKLATPGEAVIGAAMAGIIMFGRALAMEAKRDGIRVNTLTPSLIEGTLTYERVTQDGFSAKLFAKATQLAQLGLTQPEDLAHLIVFLASPEAARITGQTISPNGGISAA